MTVGIERTPEGWRLVVSRRIGASAEAAWELLVDTERWTEWGPTVRAVEADERRIEAGTTGRVRTAGGVWVPFEVTGLEGRRWSWRVAGVPATGHRVEDLGDACRVAFEIPLPAAWYAPVCERALRRIERLAG
ncbi:MAG: SRPBCC family protein [Halobacteriales archaeon]